MEKNFDSLDYKENTIKEDPEPKTTGEAGEETLGSSKGDRIPRKILFPDSVYKKNTN